MAMWLGGCSAWVATLVVLGGVTRLTRSGLSMTEWKFAGERPPLSASDWEAEFNKYKQSPEYVKLNRGMSMEQFKFIYWMEYAHRMWGRALGVVFVVPGAYFAAKGWVRGALARRLGLLLLMGGTQGFVGWWMVRSGLQEPAGENATPRVSPYRLAAHLASAFAIYSTLVWTTLGLAYPVSPTMQASASQWLAAQQLGRVVLPLSALIAVTAISGAFVAGLDAGHAYNDFPLMAGRLFPEEYWAVPGWRNAFESTAAVQLHHRVLALSTLTAVGATSWWARGLPLPRPSRVAMTALFHMTVAQVALGVTTLMTYVPVPLGSAHQTGALTLFTIALVLMHTLRPHAQLAPRVASLAAPAILTGVAGVASIAIHTA